MSADVTPFTVLKGGRRAKPATARTPSYHARIIGQLRQLLREKPEHADFFDHMTLNLLHPSKYDQ